MPQWTHSDNVAAATEGWRILHGKIVRHSDRFLAVEAAKKWVAAQAAAGSDMHARAMQIEAPGPRNLLFPIAPDARRGKEPCGECRLQAFETCDICGATAILI